MVGLKSAFASMSVGDIERARSFYVDTLGLSVATDMGSGFILDCGGGSQCFIYEKGDHVPAQHTVLNFMVGDLEASVDDLAARGVAMTPPEGMEANEKGIVVGGPGSIAWFRDPDENWLALVQWIER